MNTMTDERLAFVANEIRIAADNGGANEGQCYSWWRELDHIATRLAAAKPAQVPILAPKHEGMRVSAAGILGRVRGPLRFGAEELLKGLRELSIRFYKGDLVVVDEFLQCFALDQSRPSSAPTPAGDES